ncbi:ATP-binding cassette domain-containing protein [Corynebacterium uberis]|uniref:ATP-binding cassette domain-containing protein n=1 Tax=Corynebacterium TaxID=1716 RepID=UPI001D0AA860|nr:MULTISPECIES: ABC transporter ATP-binding protein [Corynebacterium]MCZ9308179.1 ABC transporter ATP-binding protein [Corynebacterium sp. c6VSa_13]UDL73864.1 ABC transporter ATP-binding protein [Corynebacterium uberis]UDL75253.1 ABC transporter ATP-binding protein [Corynebacterium uberis]UDL77464.1 ABC transporter ATP-binding protein [Corynebacterium uberis]UDL79750.1 ABC transporter ATP-binding protein [Corynebacterium uberis]
MSTDALLDVAGLTIGDIVTDVNFRIAPGQRVALIGESGSGKTQCALALMGLTPLPVSGHAHLGEIDLVHARPATMQKIRGARISMVFQEPMTALDPLMRAGAQIAEALMIHRPELRRGPVRAGAGAASDSVAGRVEQLLADVGLSPEHARAYPHQLSGGQRQRVCIAMALANEPDLLICDEPTTALDATVQAHILDTIVAASQRTGTALLFITHDLALVARTCSHVLVMQRGRIVERGQTDRVLRAPEHPYTRTLLAAARPGRTAPDAAAGSGDTHAPDAIAVNSVGRSFGAGRAPALDQVSLRVPAGGRLGIVGESGSGKSTLLRIIAGLDQPTAGTVSVNGTVQMVFQDPASSLDPRMSVGRSVTEGMRLRGAARRKAARDLLAQVGIDPEAATRYPHEFSGGQRQRISIARALASNPDIILADEAVSALDVTVRAQILQLLDQVVARDHRTLVFVSHDLSVVRQCCTHVAVLRRGRLVESGTVAQVWDDPQHPYTQELLAAVPQLPCTMTEDGPE